MSASRFGKMQKATAIVPLALLSAAWTASLTGVGAVTASADVEPGTPGQSDSSTTVPSQAIEAPASVSIEEAGEPGFTGNAKQIVSTSSTNGIPSAALAAYQRAETVINNADAGCNITWQLVAAIGRIESDHGRFGGSSLNGKGVATPAILGPVLDGGATATIADTDAGSLDGNMRFDRAVGPMQFIPSTWAVVGVDADNDGTRDPQDIDDAALATAVYLCSGNDDLSTDAGQRAAVYRYNHSQTYVSTVIGVMDAYLAGDFMPVPNATINAGTLTPLPTRPGPVDTRTPQQPEADTAAPVEPTETTEPAEPSEPTQPSEPTDNNNGGNNGNGSGNGDGGNDSPIKVPPIKLPQVPDTGVEPVDQVLTLTEAILQCTLDGLIDNPLNPTDKFDKCVKDYTTKG